MRTTPRRSSVLNAAVCIAAGACTTCLTALLPAGWHSTNSFGVIPPSEPTASPFTVFSDIGASEAIIGGPPVTDNPLTFTGQTPSAMRYRLLQRLIDSHTNVVFAKVAGFPLPSFSGYMRVAPDGNGDGTWEPRGLFGWINRGGRVDLKTTQRSAYMASKSLDRHWVPYRTDFMLFSFNVLTWTMLFYCVSLLHRGTQRLRRSLKLTRHPNHCPECDYPLGATGICPECGWHR